MSLLHAHSRRLNKSTTTNRNTQYHRAQERANSIKLKAILLADLETKVDRKRGVHQVQKANDKS